MSGMKGVYFPSMPPNDGPICQLSKCRRGPPSFHICKVNTFKGSGRVKDKFSWLYYLNIIFRERNKRKVRREGSLVRDRKTERKEKKDVSGT